MCTGSQASSSLTTNTTVTSSTTISLSSVYLIQDCVPSATSSTAPIPVSSSIAPVTVTRPETPLHDEIPVPAPVSPQQPVPSPALLHTPVISTQPDYTFQEPLQDSPSASATMFFRSPSVASTAHLPTPIPTTPTLPLSVSACCPDYTQPTIVHSFPVYTAFETLFPQTFYSSVGSMPTTHLLHSLVHALQWTTGVLRGCPLERPSHLSLPLWTRWEGHFESNTTVACDHFTLDSNL